MKLQADFHIELPFKIDICAQGPDVAPLICSMAGFHATLYFPPSLADQTDGQGMFGDWAWWTGRTLRLTLEREIEAIADEETLRQEVLSAGQEILSRFLNAYRWRLDRPEVHPIPLSNRAMSLSILHEDGHQEELPDSIASFLFKNMPKEPPLEHSVNLTTLARLQQDVQDGIAPPLAEQIRLDADALEAQGEGARAEWLRKQLRRVE